MESPKLAIVIPVKYILVKYLCCFFYKTAAIRIFCLNRLNFFEDAARFEAVTLNDRLPADDTLFCPVERGSPRELLRI